MQPEERRASGVHTRMPVVLVNDRQQDHKTIPPARTWPEVHNLDDEARRWLAFQASAPGQPLRRVLYTLVFKRLFDIIGAAVLLIALAPLFAIVALIIRLESPGQIIYRQQRVGRNGELFTIYKFRTMIPDRRKSNGPTPLHDRRKRHKTRTDPRVTRSGKFLRRTSIDELPQFFNILKGDMSFIGPRPEMPSIVEKYEDWQHQRHLVTPGLSGWWQVTGRSDLPMHEHTDLDIYYVVNQSFMLDLKIVLLTFRALLSRGGAF
jgi:lipopolysaccharide/colanic/teichoic acid biosynthesis glycosyltransferase